MNKLLTRLLILAAFSTLLGGCITAPDKPVQCEGESCNVDPTTSPLLKGTFVSGHLGSYYDCPEDAYSESRPAPGADVDGDFAAGACAEGVECTPILNCEGAQLTLQLTNAGEADALGVQVDMLDLQTAAGESRATLPLERILRSETNEEFDGVLAAGETVLLRIEFQGPLDPWTLLQDNDSAADARIGGGGGGLIETTLSADNHDDLKIISTELYGLPSVDT